MPDDTHPFLVKLQEATNAHDLEGVVDCFTTDYCNDAPAHPSRAFHGNEQVRRNWRQIFGSVPDVQSVVLGTAVNGPEVWSEWEMRGTRPDGTPHLMRGVIVFGLQGDRAASARFYLEPVDQSRTTVDDAVRIQTRSDSPA